MSLSSWLETFRISLFTFINFFLIVFSHPLSFSIKHFDPVANNIIYQGDAAANSSLGTIELNNFSHPNIFDQLNQVGCATYAEPLHLWEYSMNASVLANFTTSFSFTLDTLNSTHSGDGFAFFLAPVGYPIPPNSAGGDLGLFNSTTRLAASSTSQNQIVMVEFDTYSNKEWDPPGSHVGINYNTISSVVSANWDALNNSGKVCHVQITYNATASNLSVFWTYEEKPKLLLVNTTWTSLSYQIDLGKVLPEWVTFGFSASTGAYAERHAIHSWEFHSNMDSYSTYKEKRKKAFLIDAVVASFFILMLSGAICWLLGKEQIMHRILNFLEHGNNDHVPSTSMDLEILAFPRRFAYQELVAATNGFAKDRRLGQGASGQVYKGIIQDLGCTVAVKRIFAESERYEKIFINEVKIISRIIHRNLVQFIGWCYEQGECLLVYAYMPNSSLDTHLYGNITTLQWEFRYKIAFGLASALHYLHEDAEQCVLHRDIKSANVLLDSDFRTKLGDFGIAKLVDPRSRTHHTTGVAGTFGYIAPEYAFQGRASKESDMYSFGVVALELACGRRTYQDGEYHVPLFSWVWQLYLAGNLLCAADERLEMNFDRNEIECLLIVGLWCTNPNPKERPKAGQVMKVLQLEAPLPQLPHDMHDHHTLPQPQQQAGSSQVSFTNSLDTVGR